MRTFWLSFVDPTRPVGQGFLGVVVVDVSPEEAVAIVDVLRAQFPRAAEGAEWLAAATRKAWSWGCNPGGEVAAAELDPATCVGIPRNRLLTGAELKQYGCQLSEIHQ